MAKVEEVSPNQEIGNLTQDQPDAFWSQLAGGLAGKVVCIALGGGGEGGILTSASVEGLSIKN